MNTAAAKGIGNPQDTLVFWLWRNMPYNRRMLISFGLIVLGFLLQWYSGEIFSGVIPLLAGNALLLVRGYDNRVEFKGFDPGQQWQKVERRRLYELEELDRKMKRWDRSFIDITNAWGVVTFVLLVAGLFMMYVFFDTHSAYQGLAVIPVDMGILLLPHWFFGTRTLQRKPGLLIKVGVLLRVLDLAKRPGLQRDAMMLLKGKEKAMPEDVKIRLLPDDAPEDFLGLYGQVVINNVQGKSYPYFYMVLVARPGMGLQACLRPRDRFWDIPVPKIDSAFDNLFVPQPSWSPSTTQQLRKLVAAPYLAPNDWTPRSEAYFVFPLAQGTPGKQCGLAATGVYQPSLRSPWLAA
ncbi:hypothetical protein, partial [Thiolapillus sp.]